MLNIIACNNIAYQNAYKEPKSTFIVGDMAKIRYITMMASTLREGFFYDGKDKMGIQGMESDNYLFGLWRSTLCQDRNDVLKSVREMLDYTSGHDCKVYAYKPAQDKMGNNVGVEATIFGLNDDGQFVNVSLCRHYKGCVLDTSAWSIVHTATELAEKILETLEPLLAKAREWEREHNKSMAEKRANIADLKRKIKAEQAEDRPVDNKVFDPDLWWKNLSEDEKLKMLNK